MSLYKIVGDSTDAEPLLLPALEIRPARQVRGEAGLCHQPRPRTSRVAIRRRDSVVATG